MAKNGINKPTQTCCKCKQPKGLNEYGNNKRFDNGKYPICNKCVDSELSKSKNYEDTFQKLCKTMNLFYSKDLFDYYYNTEKEVNALWSKYKKHVATLNLNIFSYEDSIFENLYDDITRCPKVVEVKEYNLNKKSNENIENKSNINDEIIENVEINKTEDKIKSKKNTIDNNTKQVHSNAINYSDEEIERFIDKWGEGYTIQEYNNFEKKYRLLKGNYLEQTAMHTEALLIYIRYRVKEEMATAEGNVKEAKEWGALADKAAQNAKINPSQLSKADLSGGLTTFGELSIAVEKAIDIVPILPKFKEKPQDKPDFTLWCYINYVRDLKGLPPCEYSEIYNFYNIRKAEYDKREKELLEQEEQGEE
jgi:hypothetical protein